MEIREMLKYLLKFHPPVVAPTGQANINFGHITNTTRTLQDIHMMIQQDDAMRSSTKHLIDGVYQIDFISLVYLTI